MIDLQTNQNPSPRSSSQIGSRKYASKSQIDLSPLEKMPPKKKSFFKGDKSTVVSLPKEDDFDPNEVLFIEAKQVHRSI